MTVECASVIIFSLNKFITPRRNDTSLKMKVLYILRLGSEHSAPRAH